ncbi:MAG: HAMP domain-containing sensor histidine kinase [Pseudomonadota bacterium]|nr:HAMP domain-containing sensor histidine kinase [Pseudomonadota bacterium]
MSHDLRTPLNTIIGSADLIGGASFQKREGWHPEYSGYISDAVNSLLYLVNALLDLSQIEAGKLDLAEIEADLVELLESCIVDVVGMRSHELMKLVSSLEAQRVIVEVDPVRSRQIFDDLPSNAMKFTPETCQVTLTLGRSDNGGAIVTVSDTGPGIDQDEMEKVFNPFHRTGDVLRQKQEGAGLGLSIA